MKEYKHFRYLKYLIFNLDFSISFYLLRVSPRVAIAALKFLCEHTCINFVNYMLAEVREILLYVRKRTLDLEPWKEMYLLYQG